MLRTCIRKTEVIIFIKIDPKSLIMESLFLSIILTILEYDIVKITVSFCFLIHMVSVMVTE